MLELDSDVIVNVAGGVDCECYYNGRVVFTPILEYPGYPRRLAEYCQRACRMLNRRYVITGYRASTMSEVSSLGSYIDVGGPP